MSIICNEENCTGCGACQNICPVECISMCDNRHGFLIPKIDTKKCVSCNKCRQICPSLNKIDKNIPQKTYACCANDNEIRSNCASGGLASILYEKMIQNKGIVYGVYLNEQQMAVFDRVDTSQELEKFRGYKYTGSITGGVFKIVKKDLDKDLDVLFIGMSCQVAGLLGFLGKKYDKLITVDILCHGMPSHLYFKEYIHEYEKKNNDSVESVSFRDNNLFRLEIKGKETSYECRAKYDKYFAGYTSLLFYRDSCYRCMYATPERIGDITIADFWGYKNEKKFEPTDLGVSMALLNSEKGILFFEKIRKSIKAVPSILERALEVNEQLRGPSKEHPLRLKFLEAYKFKGFIYASENVIAKVIKQNRMSELWGITKRYLSLPKRVLRYARSWCRRKIGKAIIGKKVREIWRNKVERKNLLNSQFTILSNTCIGGIIYHDMGMEFLSPTVNTYIRPADFVKFLQNIEFYLSLELVEIEHPANYPVAKLGDLVLYLKHYKCFEDARDKWEKRKKRINYDNLFVMMTDRDFAPPDKWRRACSEEVLEEFDKLPFEKVCFTAKQYSKFKSCRTIEKNKSGSCVGIITDVVSYSGKRLYQYADNFDYIKWLNN